MKCPYCGYLKPIKEEGSFRVHKCPRCDYLFEISFGEAVLEKILSIPFSSLLYSPAIFTINYFVAKWTYSGGYFDFGVFLSFHILISIFTVLFILFVTTRGSTQIFIIKNQAEDNFVQTVKSISPLVKIAGILFIVMIIVPFVVN